MVEGKVKEGEEKLLCSNLCSFLFPVKLTFCLGFRKKVCNNLGRTCPECNSLKSLSRLHAAEMPTIDNLSSLWWWYLNASLYGSGIMIPLNNIGAGETEAINMANELDLQKSLSNAWQLVQDQVSEFIPWNLYHGVYTGVYTKCSTECCIRG